MIKVIVALLLSTAIYASCLIEELGGDYRFMTYNGDNEISRTQLLAMYSGRINNWSSGIPISIYVRPYNDYSQNHMVITILGISPNTFHQYTKTNRRIKVVKKCHLIAKVKGKIGSIGLVDENTALLNVNGLVSVVRITDE